MDFMFLNLELEVTKSFPLCFGHPNLAMNIFHISFAIFPYRLLCHFYISTQFMDFMFLNLKLEVTKSFPLCFGHPNLAMNIFHISFAIFPYRLLCHFYISFLNQPGVRERRTGPIRV